MVLGVFLKDLISVNKILAGTECILHFQRNLEHSILIKRARGVTLLHHTTDTPEL